MCHLVIWLYFPCILHCIPIYLCLFTLMHHFTTKGSLAYKTSLTHHLLLKCMYQVRKVISHVHIWHRLCLCFCVFTSIFWNCSDGALFYFSIYQYTRIINYQYAQLCDIHVMGASGYRKKNMIEFRGLYGVFNDLTGWQNTQPPSSSILRNSLKRVNV